MDHHANSRRLPIDAEALLAAATALRSELVGIALPFSTLSAEESRCTAAAAAGEP